MPSRRKPLGALLPRRFVSGLGVVAGRLGVVALVVVRSLSSRSVGNSSVADHETRGSAPVVITAMYSSSKEILLDIYPSVVSHRL